MVTFQMCTPEENDDTPVQVIFESRRERFDQERKKLARHANLISTGRLIAFLISAAGLVAGFWGWHLSSPLWAGLGGLFFGLFIVLVLWHDRVLGARDRAALLVTINEEAIHRLKRDWQKLPRRTVPLEVAQDPVARDLDLMPTDRGRASLFQLLGTTHTPQGDETLTHWLLTPAAPSEVELRQAAVAELSPMIGFRQELERRARELGEDPPDPEKFLAWAEGDSWLLARPWLLWISRGLTFLALGLMVLVIIGRAPLAWLIILGLFNLVFAAVAGRKIRDIFEEISGRGQTLRHYASLFQLLAQLFQERSGGENASREVESGRPSWFRRSTPGAGVPRSAKMQSISEALTAEGRAVSLQMQRLERLAGLADARHTPLFHLPLIALTLWDFHVLVAFERWQERVGPRVRGWFGALGEVEGLCALAALHHAHPNWSFPEMDNERDSLLAEGLGHPLLPLEACVVNDVEIGPSDRFLLVTGSNMSGKSTLLRAIGINAVLAQAGGPVFAGSLTLPPLTLGTSFRVQDSIEAGVSFFMAELRRLKEVVDLASEVRDGKGRRLLYLLDEILQGTNVYERQVAVRRVILHLLREGAIGAVSTHDLTLAEADTLTDACIPCHFTESYEPEAEGGPRMTFDYTLRSGVATTVNALKLLAMVGLGDEE